MPAPPPMDRPPVAAQPPPVGTDPVLFDRTLAGQVLESVAWTRGQYRLRPQRGTGGRGGLVWAWKALTGLSGIPAASAPDTPGSAVVTLQRFDDSTGKWVSADQLVTAYNPSTSGPVAGSTYVTLLWVGVWEVVLEPCS